MGRRLDLHQLLKKIYEETTHKNSDKNVWYQPPATVRLTYPSIIYKLNDLPPTFANNLPYEIEHMYELTVIDTDPNSALREKIAKLPQCRLVRIFESDNLHHYVFHIYD